MVGHDTVVVQDNLNNSQQGAEVEKLEREEDQLKKEDIALINIYNKH